MTITVTPINDISTVQDAANTVVNLLSSFDDPRTTGLVARFELFDTSLAGGITNVVLFDQPGAGAPLTVQNFQSYVDDEDYVNSIIHRSVQGFVVQGGGFTVDDTDTVVPQDLITNPATVLDRVPTEPPVTNEFGTNRSNTRGTLAMARSSAVNSATSQWFFNLGDNSGLDTVNEGFTVFGEVLSSSDLAVIDAIDALPVLNANDNDLFGNLPLVVENNILPNPLTAENFVRYRSITVSQRDELTFSIVGNSNPNAVSATIVNNQLVIDYLPGQLGTAAITVRATNLFGETEDDTFLVNITSVPTTNGPDSLNGSVGDDVINGRGGNDRINGRTGNDRLIGGGGNDRLIGGAGNDTLLGKGGNDRLNGNAGNDTLLGGGGDDTLKAGSGRDELNGGRGSDTLIGGGDRDLFVLSRGRGDDTIRRFRNGQDRLQVRGVRFNNLTIAQQGNNTLISNGNDLLATLNGVRANTINQRDFV
ncbi:MAG: peptidylprolyl isomerase [Cyanobacteria bacterium P01_E01_bin.6]